MHCQVMTTCTMTINAVVKGYSKTFPSKNFLGFSFPFLEYLCVDISTFIRKLHEVVQTFPVGENRSTEQSPNTSDVQVSESPESTPTTSHMVTRRSRSRTPKSSTNANVVETSRSKRKNTSVPRSEVSVKLQRLDVEKISLNNRRKSIDVLTPG